MREDIKALQNQVGYSFQDTDKILSALTHQSIDSNSEQQRLEYLGDSIIQLIASELLFSHFPQACEGELTQRRSVLVCTDGLATLAQKIHLGDFLIFNETEEKRGAKQNPVRLAEAFEALIGAFYLDADLARVKKFLVSLWGEDLEKLTDSFLALNPKGKLQQELQALSSSSIEYHLISKVGKPHCPSFLVQVLWQNHSLGEGEGKNLKEAEKKAAQDALTKEFWKNLE